MEKDNADLEIFKKHVPMAQRLAMVYRKKLPHVVLTDDLVAAALSGLWDAVTKRKSDGPDFTFYASVRVRGAILDELRTQDWLPRRFRKSQGQNASQVFLDDPDCAVGRGMTSDDNVEDNACRGQERIALEPYLSGLPERERDVITRIYFRHERLRDIGEAIGVSEPRVSQIHSRAIGMLRTVVPEFIMESVRDRQ